MPLLAQFFLTFTEALFLVPIILLGYFFWDKKIFTRALFLLLFSMILNRYLKSIWQVPLLPHLGDGWAYPSGHMQAAVSFYGWLALEFRNRWITLSITIGLAIIAWALVFQGYHTPEDILGALLFGGASILLYALLCRIIPVRFHVLLGLILVIPGLVLISLMPKEFPYLWAVIAGLGGFSVLAFFDKIERIV